MKVEEAKKIVDRQFENLVSTLEQGQSDALKAYFAAMAKFHQYSFRNLMLIFSQRPEATRVAGFNTWKKQGRWVKKGEKGIVIIAPMVLRSKYATGAKPVIASFSCCRQMQPRNCAPSLTISL